MMRRATPFLALAATASGKVFFSEDFSDGWASRWVPSKAKEAEGNQGKWVASAGKWNSDQADLSLGTTEDMRFYGMSASFDSFSNKDMDLIIQYTANYQKDVECGGGYVKIGPKMEDPTTFGDPTAYNIMFGPDKCGYNKRTHLIFSYKGKNVLKKTDLDYKQETDKTTHLYRLTLKKDNTAKVEIDREVVYEGSLKEDWELLKPKEIEDAEDKKPDGWVDDSMVDDPETKKPDDWIEEKRVVDGTAKKPEDWDDEEDGDWEPPMKDNAEYKGEWYAKRISNPDYKGFWQAKKVPNPEFKDDDTIYMFEDFGFIGFDLWQVKGGSLFDDVILTDDVAEADKLAEKWTALNKHEQEEKAKDKPADSKPDAAAADDDDDDDDEEKTEA